MQSHRQLHQHNGGDKQRYGNKNKELRGRNFLRWFHRNSVEPFPADEPGQVHQVAACSTATKEVLGSALRARDRPTRCWSTQQCSSDPVQDPACGHVSVKLVHAYDGGLASCWRVGSTQLRVKAAGAESTCCVLKKSEPKRGCTRQQSEAHGHSASGLVLRILKPDWLNLILQLLTHNSIQKHMEIHNCFPESAAP